MDTISNKELRLLVDIVTDDYRKACPRKPLTDYIQYRIYDLTGVTIAKSKIINVKPFKKIVKRTLISKKVKLLKVIKKGQKRKALRINLIAKLPDYNTRLYNKKIYAYKCKYRNIITV